MLIHTNKMETNVFIQECQEFTKTSKGMQEESRHFQCSSRSLLLPLFILLGLLIGGMIGFVSVWMEQVATQSYFILEQNKSINVSGEANTYNIFKVPQNGTYFLYCSVKKNENAKQCKDYILLAWRRAATPGFTSIQQTIFYKSSDNYVAEIAAFDIKLEENNEVHLQTNCNINDEKANLLYRVYQIKSD